MKLETKPKNKSSFKAGIYLLENLTSGMYNDPLSIYREYIQNAVDSIDIGLIKGRDVPMAVHIDLDPFKRQITIRDNGIGIPSEIAEEVLSSIGSSNKNDQALRGFRGIGRLGGIAFSDKAIFRTKAAGEKIESIQTWDCLKLRNLIDTKDNSLSFKQFFNIVTEFSWQNGKHPDDSYFEVTLEGVSSFRNHIFDLETISGYLSQVAPVPFNYDDFSHGNSIDKYLQENLGSYKSYNIILNGNKIYKPYSSYIKTSMKKGGTDIIENIRFCRIKGRKEEALAYGWYGSRKNLLGSIKRGERYSGIRVRSGNILIGDSHLLDRCFREERFNSYMIGEIHVESPNLIPNSRRDDFIDNETKTLFYNGVEKEMGLPVSKEIRLMSRINADKINIEKHQKLQENINQNKDTDNKIKATPPNVMQRQDVLTKIKTCCGNCPKFHDISNIIGG